MSRLFNDAQSEYLQIGRPVITGYPFSMGGFVYCDADAARFGVLWIGDSTKTDRYHMLRLRGDVVGDPAEIFSYNDEAEKDSAVTTTGYSLNTWHHVCAVLPASNDRSVFIDGGSKGTNNTDINPVGFDRTAIGGARDSTPGYYMSGRIVWPFIYDVALSDLEIWLLAQGRPPWMIRPAHLIGFWLPFGDRTDRDFSGRGYHMTAYNTPTHAPDPPKIASFRQPGMTFGRRMTRRVTDPRFKHWSLPWAKAPAVRRIFITHT